VKHFNAYIICATPRSGSTLLCDLLTDTGVAGQPDSFFRRESFPEWTDYFGLSVENWRNKYEFDSAYLSAVQRYGTNGTAIFGMRLMHESLHELAEQLKRIYPNPSSDKALFQSAFNTPFYLHLSRDDKLAQAVSLLRAEQSGLWHVASDGTERERLKPNQKPVYDSQSLKELIETLEESDKAWENWFVQQRIEPLRITYEMLSANPQTQLATILSALGQDPVMAASVKPRTMKLASTESAEWMARFKSSS